MQYERNLDVPAAGTTTLPPWSISLTTARRRILRYLFSKAEFLVSHHLPNIYKTEFATLAASK